MVPFPWRLVTVDIDGTLTLVPGWQEIARAFGHLPEYEQSNRRFFAREVGEDEHLRDLLDLATGHTVQEVEEVVVRTPKLAGIAEGVASLRALGARVALLTHNPSYVGDWYLRTYGFDDFEGVATDPLVRGRIGPPGNVRADKPGGLRLLLARSGVEPRSTVHIGDGWSDAEVFPRVGGGVALNSPLAEVARAADLVLWTRDFRDVVPTLARLLPRR